MDKQYVLEEIRRTARANNGVALGRQRFETETGKYSDWHGRFWTKWGDAVREAGLEANRMAEAFDDEFLLEKLVGLTRELGHVPVQGDILMARRTNPAFPSEKAFRRFRSKAQRAARVIAYCNANPGRDDVGQSAERPVADDGDFIQELESQGARTLALGVL